MKIYWEFLPAEFVCERKNNTIHVYLQQDISLLVNKSIPLQLPVAFKINDGVVVLDAPDKRLVPVKQIFLTNSDNDGLRVIFYNRSYQVVDMNKGDLLCILRHLN